MPIPPLAARFLRTRWPMVWIDVKRQGSNQINVFAPLCIVREMSRKCVTSYVCSKKLQKGLFVLAVKTRFNILTRCLSRA